MLRLITLGEIAPILGQSEEFNAGVYRGTMPRQATFLALTTVWVTACTSKPTQIIQYLLSNC